MSAPPTADSFIFCDYGSRISAGCKLHDGVTNEGLAFNPDHFVEWKRPFQIVFISGFNRPIPYNDFLTRIDVYYYSNASLGYGLCGVPSLKVFTNKPHLDYSHLTFINNYEVSQSDNGGTRMLSMITLNPKPLTNGVYYFGFRFSFSYQILQQKFQSVKSDSFQTKVTTLMCICSCMIMTLYFYRSYSFFCCSNCIQVS